MRQTSTLGMRRHVVERYVAGLAAWFIRLQARYGGIRRQMQILAWRIAFMPQNTKIVSGEVARQHNVPIHDVYAASPRSTNAKVGASIREFIVLFTYSYQNSCILLPIHCCCLNEETRP
jgi:uncharacterized protein (DUF111 family)